MKRTIKGIVTGNQQVDGAGVKLVRVIGYNDVVDFDPFLMLDAFDSENPEDYIKGFPFHPHRGIETVTYLIKGNIEHKDNLGNGGNILDGCCQWMTAGRAIIHQEMPQPSKRMLGVQLWLNLPKIDKMTEPQYRDLKAEMIPKVIKDGYTVAVISGEFEGTKGATQGDYVKMQYLDVDLKPNETFHLNTKAEDRLFIYIVEGEGIFEEEGTDLIKSKNAVLFNDGDTFMAKTLEKGVRFLVFSGKPLKEPIAWGGPIVMNTEEELRQAFKEINEGTFVRKM